MENNAKILEYQQKSCNQTPKGSQNAFLSTKHLMKAEPGTNMKKTNSFKEQQQQNINQIQTQFHIHQKKIGDNISNFCSLPVQVQNFDSEVRLSKNAQHKKMKQGILKMTKPQASQ